MKITNFRALSYVNEGRYNEVLYAYVDVTTGFWRWKKTITRTVYREYTYWRFVHTGRFTPGDKVECLAHSYIANSRNPKRTKGQK